MAAPWEKDWSSFAAAPVAQTPAADAKPWEKDWSGAVNATAPAAPVSTAEDVAKSAASGLANGAVGIPGLPGDAQAALKSHNPFDWLARKYEAYDPAQAAKNKALADKVGRVSDVPEFDLPTTAEIKKATGADALDYTPQTTGGRYMKATAEFVPGAVLGPARSAADVAGNLARFAVAPGVASEAAGEATKGSQYEPWARTAAGLAAGSLAPRIISPVRTDAAHAAQVATLEAEGVTDMRAGQRTGSKRLQNYEDAATNTPFSGHDAGTVNERQAEQFTNAALRRVGEHGPADAPNRATPEVIDRAYARIGGNFDRLSANNRMEGTRALGVDLQDAERNYQSLTPPNARAPIVADTIRDIGDAIANNGGSLPGDAYQALRSRLSAAARGSSDPQLSHVLSDMTESLDDAMSRSIRNNNPADIGGFEQARRQYRNMLVIERAAAAAGENASKGLLSPAMLASSAKAVMGKRAWSRGQGEFEPLARAGVGVLTPLPNSGTSQRAEALHHLQLAGLLGAGGDVLSGSLLGGVAGLAAPAVVARGLLSRPVQSYLGNGIAANAPRLAATPQGQYMRLRGLLSAADNEEGDHMR